MATTRVTKPEQISRAVRRGGGSEQFCKGSHVKAYGPDGRFLGIYSSHGELGPKASAAWTKVLIAAGLLTAFACAFSGLIAGWW